MIKGPDNPYPYEIEDIPYKNLKEANEADILIIGDRMGKKITPYVLPIIEKTSGKFKKELKLYNWSESYEGMHRTLAKVKSLSQWPSLIIYHGASEEFHEKRASLTDHEKILKNFEYLKSDILSSLILTIPRLSRILYHSINKIKLTELIHPDEKNYTSIEKQKQMEIIYKLFEYELDELIRLTINNKSRLILLTTPLNLSISPKKICHNSITPSIVNEQKKIEELLEENKYLKAFDKAQKLIKKSIGNARSFHLTSQAAIKLHKQKMARDYGNIATAFDCQTWRGNSVLNSIVTKAALSYQIRLLDFNYLVNRNLGEQSFFDELFPEEIYYQKLGRDIVEVSLEQLKL